MKDINQLSHKLDKINSNLRLIYDLLTSLGMILIVGFILLAACIIL